jgi:hypothetical protein
MAMADNWLTDGVTECRKIERFLKGRERRDEVACIIGRLQGHSEGAQFLGESSKLREAIEAGLDEAAKTDKEAAVEGYIGPSPGQSCVGKMCELLNVDYSSLTMR